MMPWPIIPRCLSYFSTTTQAWEGLGCLRLAQKPTFTLASWNIDHFSPLRVERAKFILDRVLEGPNTPDVVFFQEVHREARTSILAHPKVRRAFFASDAEDDAAFAGVTFATMTLLSREGFVSGVDPHNTVDARAGHGVTPLHARVARVKLRSAYRRDALSVDVLTASPTQGTFLRLVNVHLDSLADAWRNRARQMDLLTDYLREPGCAHGIIAGDFNAVVPQDETLVDQSRGLLDAWEELHGAARPDGHTSGVGAELPVGKRLRPARRLDKVVMTGATPKNIQLLRPGSIRVSDRNISIPWSDHCGLECTFAIE
ncbi:Endonuclease/exonuclease/phosphatase [Mycena pura]|uniref:Endonuclease/exonuclease/phosphatase n=1 Tax=Mycena pura TaxID=153505 RepID=A0AAD6YUQ9_9AGAR|nr:Endonuclease/exonuclease/phosphatase [Mycena pura]